ncbi:U11 U12 small nuclear ribonucleo 25 kDa isoform X1 [Labeo rohita]|uniref:U11 U12 small nuclear ribonucleo 25 kDa isoform X1 n=1 Tax=Labeo rohita TaxID=84645 RepID=A0A498L828_LABRO|nr:U11 U12 small nuclear ribonucleo 25 kDa isoform X1 [Labeo rohita]RXN11215.1 U11 U12 small nuclear ribonucleo 25 kDa isoform X1 [Labeo rohita]
MSQQDMGSNTMTPVLPQDSEQDGDLWNILFRRQQLQNRHQFLQEIQKKNNRIEDPIQAPFQGLYILPVSSTEIPPIIPVQEENTETVSPTIEENTEPPEPPDPPISLDDVTVSPAKVKCPTCQKIVTTEIHYKLGSNAFLFCCLLSVVGCLAGCCLVPFCMNRFKDVTHRCPSCHSHICSVDRI